MVAFFAHRTLDISPTSPHRPPPNEWLLKAEKAPLAGRTSHNATAPNRKRSNFTRFSDPVLVNDWYVVAHLAILQPGELYTARLLEEDLVIWLDNGWVEVW